MCKPSENLAEADHRNSIWRAPEYSSEQRRILLAIAHEAIDLRIAGKPFPDWRTISPDSSLLWPALEQPRGVFTTLYLLGKLRGCVGYAKPMLPLSRAVAETACAAAFEDSRFWPVAAEETSELRISLSILSLFFPIKATQVQVGRHGLSISDGVRRGLLLPQVPVEHDWDRETFLEQTCRKAGLPLDAWEKSATIEAFEAEVFGDDCVSR